MPITNEDVKDLVKHDQFVIAGAPSFDDLVKVDEKLARAVSFGYNAHAAKISSFDIAAVILTADPSNPPANSSVVAHVVFKHKSTGKKQIFVEYALDRWATAFALAELAVPVE